VIDRDRPSSLTALAILAALVGLILLVASTLGAIALIGLGAGLGAPNGIVSPTQVWALISFSILSVGSVLYLVFAVGTFASSPTAWWAGIVGAIASLISTGVVVAIGGGGEVASLMVSVGFAIAMLAGLLRVAAIRAYFGR
jgi:hypothetical protein